MTAAETEQCRMPAINFQEAPPCLTLGLPADLSPQLPPFCSPPWQPSLPALPPPVSQTPPEVSAGPGAFAIGNTGTSSPECTERLYPEAFKRASHRRVPTGLIISPHFTDGELWPQDLLIFQEGTKARHQPGQK